MKRTLTLSAAALLALSAAALAQDAQEKDAEKQPAKTLTIGDKAPPIDIEHWIKGDKVEKFEDGNVYIVEFWATWCGPCKVSMPHLSEAQKQYKDYNVTFIGISDESLDKVSGFLKQKKAKDSEQTWDEVIGYTLTTDPDKSTHNDYQKAAGVRGIPSAFIVGRDQHIEWIGNPHPQSDDGFDKALEAVVKGSWDRDAYKAEWEKAQKAEREQASAQEAQMKAYQPMMQAVRAQDWNKAIELADAILEKNPKDIQAGMTKFTALMKSGDTQKAYGYAQTLAKAQWENPMILNALAWTIVDDPDIKDRDTELALQFANQANTLTKNEDPAILDTVARCYYESGDLKNAVKYQEMAVKHAGDDEMASDIKAALKKYQDELAKKGG
jgi:thiol-disulfide isomerase/thioredoxin